FSREKSNAENAELVKYAFAKGINYFDTAPGYCADTSEDIYGEAFKDMDRSKFFVSTKAMPERVPTADKAYEIVCRSIERLKVDKIDFYHIWCIRHLGHYELSMRPGGQHEGLLKAKEEGLIDEIVCSSHLQGDEIKEILEDSKVAGILLGVNILNFPYRWSAVKYAKEHGLGVVAMNPLGGGIIPSNADKLGFLCGENDSNPVEAALRFTISCSDISVALVGFTTPEHIDIACEIADKSQSFTEQELKDISEKLGSSMNETCTTCCYCKDCPKNIKIPQYMQFYNKRVMFDATDEEMKEQLKHDSVWGILVGPKATADECIECGMCEKACTQHLPIIERLKQIAVWEKEISDG
ncbi:MAG: aldo/keto reductase, partial [Planctomycetota bacterium]